MHFAKEFNKTKKLSIQLWLFPTLKIVINRNWVYMRNGSLLNKLRHDKVIKVYLMMFRIIIPKHRSIISRLCLYFRAIINYNSDGRGIFIIFISSSSISLLFISLLSFSQKKQQHHKSWKCKRGLFTIFKSN